MTDEEINIAIHSQMPQLYVIVKRCHAPFCYYREGAAGYTNSLLDAWKVDLETAQKYQLGRDSDYDKVRYEPVPPPDYCNDLNAMHEAEKVLTYEQIPYYMQNLFYSIIATNKELGVSEYDKVAATARQRAEAFLRTLNLWKQ